MVFWISSQIIPGIELFQRLPVPLEHFLRGREVDAELHQSFTVARAFKVIARVRLFVQPGERHVDVATIFQGADGEVMFDEIHNQLHTVSPCLGSRRTNFCVRFARKPKAESWRYLLEHRIKNQESARCFLSCNPSRSPASAFQTGNPPGLECLRR
jgi:hypothetical protein